MDGLNVMARRVEIDRRAPFKSVKEAVSLFGEKVLAGELVYTGKLKEVSESMLLFSSSNPFAYFSSNIHMFNLNYLSAFISSLAVPFCKCSSSYSHSDSFLITSL